MNAKMQKISPKTLSILIGVAGVAVVALGLFLAVMPEKRKAAELSQQVVQTDAQIVSARAAAAKKPEPAIRVANLFKLAKAMPDQMDMTGIVLELQKTANEAGIEFDSIQPGTPAAGTGYTVQPLALTFDGKFFTITNFLERLRKLVDVHHGKLDARGRLFSVTEIHFGPGTRGFPSIGATVNVNAYVYDASPAVPAATTTPTTTTSSPTDAVASGATP